MGFLLIHHELLRAKAKVNSLTYDQSMFKRKQDRIKDAIKKKEEYYNKRETALENEYKNAKSTLTNAVNACDFAAAGSIAGVPGNITQVISGAAAGLNGASIWDPTKMLDGWTKNGDEYIYNKDGKTSTVNASGYAQYQLNAQQQINTQLQQLKASYQTVMDQFLESIKEQQKLALEDEKDAALLPLKDEDSDMDIKISTNEVQLQTAKDYKDSLKQALTDQVKDSVPKFGLG
ncbi:hypothetical protein IJI31_02235 [bacterium]|nr:hypothetical protein [bacterium]